VFQKIHKAYISVSDLYFSDSQQTY